MPAAEVAFRRRLTERNQEKSLPEVEWTPGTSKLGGQTRRILLKKGNVGGGDGNAIKEKAPRGAIE